MTANQALKIKEFSAIWITKVVAKRKDYCKRLLDALDDLIPDDIEKTDGIVGYGILDIENWDYGEYGGMGDRLTELVEFENIYNFTKKAKLDFICTLRIAIDLFIKGSGGVVGYTVGDLKKAFDGNIPKEIIAQFEPKLETAKNEDHIWL